MTRINKEKGLPPPSYTLFLHPKNLVFAFVFHRRSVKTKAKTRRFLRWVGDVYYYGRDFRRFEGWKSNCRIMGVKYEWFVYFTCRRNWERNVQSRLDHGESLSCLWDIVKMDECELRY